MNAGTLSAKSRLARGGVALLLAAMLAAAPALPGCAARDAAIDSHETPMASTGETDLGIADSTSTSASDTLTIIAGAAHPVSTEGTKGTDNERTTYTFPNLKVISTTDRPIKSITVQFTTEVVTGASGDAIELNTATIDGVTFTRWSGGKDVNQSANADGATAEQWEKYLQENLKVTLKGTGTKGLRMIASFEPVNRTLDYNSLNGHYYEVGKKTNGSADVGQSWSYALKQAEKSTYMGMQGYLVTVTSEEEQKFVFSLVNTDTWIGGTCDDTYTGRTSAWAKNYRIPLDQHPTRWATSASFVSGGWCSYYWVSGPEAGTKMGECLNSSNRKNAVDPETGETMYMNWSNGQPDGGASTGEKWMQLAVKYGTSQSGGPWNDLPENYGNMYYIIEYGGMPDDYDPDADVDANVNVDVDVDVFVKVDIKIDPSGHTLYTEASNTTVGTKPVITDTVNGDPNVMTNVGDDQQPAEIKRTFYKKDSEGKWQPVSGDDLSDGYPVHAGTYKVVSEAPYAMEGGEVTEWYKESEATFTIKPKVLDPATDFTDTQGGKKLADLGGAEGADRGGDDEGDGNDTGDGTDGNGSGDGNGGSGSDSGEGTGGNGDGSGQGQRTLGTFNKVYDGTDTFDFTRLGFPGLDGADVKLVVTGASYDGTGAGKRTLTLTGVSLEGEDAGDYVIPGLKDGVLTVEAWIAPRELVVTARSTVAFGAAGSAMTDASGKLAELYSDEDVHDDDAAPWLENMLADPDAERADSGIESVLGEASHSCLRDGDGAALNPSAPEAGLYTVSVSFANVAAALAAPEASPAGAVPQAFAAELPELPWVVQLAENRFDIGNYVLELRPTKVLVSEDPAGETRLGEIGELVVDEKVTQTADPKARPIDPAGIDELVKKNWPDKVPSGSVPRVTITKDGSETGTIDPTVPGTYTVVVVYPDPEGGPDKIARLTYEVTEPEPEPEPKGGETGTTPPDKWPGAGGWLVDEEVTIPVDPSRGPIGKDEIAGDLEERFGDRDGFPTGVDPVIRITRDGVEVGSIDPTVPGTYVVEAEYTMPDGTKRYVRTVYTVAPQEDGGHTTYILAPDPDDEGGKGGLGLLRLAQTGDTLAIGAVAGVVALAALLLALAFLRLRKRKDDE